MFFNSDTNDVLNKKANDTVKKENEVSPEHGESQVSKSYQGKHQKMYGVMPKDLKDLIKVLASLRGVSFSQVCREMFESAGPQLCAEIRKQINEKMNQLLK